MSVTTQIIFPYTSDARAPAMDVHMAPQGAGIARSFWLFLSALLKGDNADRSASRRSPVPALGSGWYDCPVQQGGVGLEA